MKLGTYRQTFRFQTFRFFYINEQLLKLSTADDTENTNVIPTALCYWLTSLIRNGNQTSDILHRDKQNIHFGPVKIFRIINSQY